MEDSCSIITGASRGIGKAIAIALAREKHNLILTYNVSKKKAENLAKSISKKYMVKAYAIKADMASYSDIDNMVKFALSKFSKVDILINNAGICTNQDLKERTMGEFEKTFKVNLFGIFYLSRIIGNHMAKNKYGKIINISSNNSINGFDPVTIDYDASKGALNLLTKDLAIKYSPYVNVNAIAPGWIDTDMNKGVLTPDIKKLEAQKILKRRIGKPEDVANLVCFLVSSKADYIDGQVIVIDGGMF